MAFHIADDGCRIHVRLDGPRLGSAGLPLVLIPGLGGEGAFWQGVADRLAPHHSLIRIDHRGAGQSERPDPGPQDGAATGTATGGVYTIPRIARDVLGVLDDLGLTRAHVIGHSTGGMIGQTLATKAPERLAGLVVSASWDRVDLRFRLIFEARLALLEQAGPVAYHKLTQALGYDPDWIEAHAPALAAELAAAPARLEPLAVQAARIRMLLDHDVHDRLGAIRSPTLVMGGLDDALIPYAYSRRLARAIPGARLVEMRGGHFYPRAHPDRFATEVSVFLQGLNP